MCHGLWLQAEEEEGKLREKRAGESRENHLAGPGGQ